MCACYNNTHVERGRLPGAGSPHHIGPRDQTLFSLGTKYLYSLSHLLGSRQIVLLTEKSHWTVLLFIKIMFFSM